jgi:D-alanine--D-alanine ligase
LKQIKVWVLAPILETEDPNLAYYSDYEQSFEDYKKAFEELNAEWQWQPVRIHDFKQIIDKIADEPTAGKTKVVFNLCDGDDTNGMPGISVLHYLKQKQLIYTGADAAFYDITTSKITMKQAFDKAAVPTPAWEVIAEDNFNVAGIFDRLGKPLILKPAISAGSMGVTVKSVVDTEGGLLEQIALLNQGYRGWTLTHGGLFVEGFVNGFEFTTFIIGDADDDENAHIYPSIERVFNKKLPENEQFLSFDRLWEIYEDEAPIGAHECLWEYAQTPQVYEADIRRISWAAYKSVGGKGYGRVDLRMDRDTKQLSVLEVNAQCGLSEDENYTSIGAILRFEGLPFSHIVKEIIENALRSQKTHPSVFLLNDKKNLKICVLQPDYSTSGVDYQYYDPPRHLSVLWKEAHFDHVFLNKLTTYKQLKALSKQGYDVFLNLCEGYLEWEIPSIDVIYTLELLNLPFTGPTSLLYDPPKELMKYVAYTEGVRTPNYVVVASSDDLVVVDKYLSFPLFVKPAKAGDSLGIDVHSLVKNKEELAAKVAATIEEYPELLVEEYIEGREFTVLVAAKEDGSLYTFAPVEFIFPEGTLFKTYALKTSELHPKANVPVLDNALNQQLRDAAWRIFKAFDGVGYGRLDFRMNSAGEIYFLEINFTCSVFYTNGYEGSADYILKHDGIGQTGFLKHIVAEGIARHQRKQKKYVTKGNAINGYGIYAQQNLPKDTIVFKGEGKSQRIITRNYVKTHWNAEQQEIFRRYAYPLSSEVFILWDNTPEDWSPQNHSCDPNTAFQGLDVVTIRPVARGEELTFDYATVCNQDMEPFDCQCGAPNCRKQIVGTVNTSVETREKQKSG